MGAVVSRTEINQRLAPLRGQSAIVTTNGCFDILHVGHLRYLQFCKQQGQVLVVCLNTDASIRRLKGPTRPIVPEADRAELLAALACVDFVVPFDEDTPVDLLGEIRPDIHVKGDQYSLDTLPEAEALRALGVDIRFAPMVAGRSTTNIVDRIRQAEAADASASC